MMRETQTPRILVVEDEEKLLAHLSRTLEEEKFKVDSCESFSSLEEIILMNNFTYDVVILDRLLYSRDSVQLIPQIKERQPRCKILILSAINTSSEKASILNMGADDYLSKPFASEELIARIRVLHRRVPMEVRLGNLVLDTDQRVITVDGIELSLQNREFVLLKTLVQSPGKIFNKNFLYEQVWGVNTDIESNVIEATVNKLRRRLKEIGANVIIKNTRNVGYWIEE